MTALLHALALNGYGAYVWPAYGFAALVLIALFVAANRRLRRAEREAEDMRAVLRGPRPRS
jgi:heme exporter protein D